MNNGLNLFCRCDNQISSFEVEFYDSSAEFSCAGSRNKIKIVRKVIFPHCMESEHERNLIMDGIHCPEISDYPFSVDMNHIGLKFLHRLFNPVPFVKAGKAVFLGDKTECNRRNSNDFEQRLFIAFLFIEECASLLFLAVLKADNAHGMTVLYKLRRIRVDGNRNAIDTRIICIGKHRDFHIVGNFIEIKRYLQQRHRIYIVLNVDFARSLEIVPEGLSHVLEKGNRRPAENYLLAVIGGDF